jgi:hypothetical protein
MVKYLTVILCLLTISIKAQLPTQIEAGIEHSTYIVFPSNITVVDVGTQDFIYSIPDSNNDMIFIKAASSAAQRTSIMIRTENEVYVSYLVYKEDPSKLLFDLRVNNVSELITSYSSQIAGEITKKKTKKKEKNMVPEIVQVRMDEKTRDARLDNPYVKEKTWSLFDSPKESNILFGDSRNKLALVTKGIYVDSAYMYIKLNFENNSSLPFEIDFASFQLDESAKMKKKAAVQEKLLEVLYQESCSIIKPEDNEDIVYVFDIYPIENKDKIIIRFTELNGERTLEFYIPGKEFSNAIRI